MLVGVFISFGILLVAWLVMPVKSTETEPESLELVKMVPGEQPA